MASAGTQSQANLSEAAGEENAEPAASPTPEELRARAEEEAKRFEEFAGFFEKSFKETPVFAGDAENENYKHIVAKMREFNPEEHVEPAAEEEKAEE